MKRICNKKITPSVATLFGTKTIPLLRVLSKGVVWELCNKSKFYFALQACKVLNIKEVTVIGPTPPGTGVI